MKYNIRTIPKEDFNTNYACGPGFLSTEEISVTTIYIHVDTKTRWMLLKEINGLAILVEIEAVQATFTMHKLKEVN